MIHHRRLTSQRANARITRREESAEDFKLTDDIHADSGRVHALICSRIPNSLGAGRKAPPKSLNKALVCRSGNHLKR